MTASPTNRTPEHSLKLLRALEQRADGKSSIPPTPLQSSVVTLGNFDGVHLGHKMLLEKVITEARERGVPSVVLTFDPHPAQHLRPSAGLKLLMPIEERVERIEALGVDHIIVLQFNNTLAQMPAEQFVQELVVAAFHPALVVIGPDTRFGSERRGDASLLTQIGEKAGFTVMPMGTVTLDSQRISSSGIRKCLEGGDVLTPKAWASKPFQIEGTVVHGQGRGRKIGFRTANIETCWPTMPAAGVYIVHCQIPDVGRFFGVANLGLRPTFESPDQAKETLEVHLLSEAVPSLYGKTVRVGFLQRLRNEKRFATSDELVAQIERDILAARAAIDGETP